MKPGGRLYFGPTSYFRKNDVTTPYLNGLCPNKVIFSEGTRVCPYVGTFAFLFPHMLIQFPIKYVFAKKNSFKNWA